MAKKPVNPLVVPNVFLGFGIVSIVIGSVGVLTIPEALEPCLAAGAFGTGSALIGVLSRGKALQRQKLRERLFSVGARVPTQQLDVRYDTSYSVNDKNPWYLVAKFTVQGVTYESEGRRWWGDPEVPASVSVAYNPAEPSENTIDD